MGITKDTPRNRNQVNGKNASYEFPEKPLFGKRTLYNGYRALGVYLVGGVLGTIIWFTSQDPRFRLVGASLIFPGSGYLALSRWYILAFILNTVLIPVTLFGWFFGGAALLPLGVYYGAVVVAAFIGCERNPSSFLEYTPHVAWAINALWIWKWRSSIRKAEKAQEELRATRNTWITAQVEELDMADAKAFETRRVGSEELSLEDLGYLRHVINLTRQPMNSWKGFTRVDQFREGALRYQLYFIVYTLAMVQNATMPNFHGYISEAQRVAIEKVLLPQCLYYWALESMWGRFSLDWDPVKNENIMLPGWYLPGIMMYTSNTRDMRYMEPGSLVCQVTPFHKYPHSVPSMVDALMRNWGDSSFTLYACEPNWVFPMCNAYGALGVLIYDRVIGTGNWKKIEPRFKQSWLDDFTLPSGDTTVFRSSLTGLSVSAQGAIDNSLAMLVQSLFPDEAKKYRAKFRNECVEKDENGKLTGLKDDPFNHFDAGNYKMHEKSAVGQICPRPTLLTRHISKGHLPLPKSAATLSWRSLRKKHMKENVDLKDDGNGGIFPDDMSTMAALQYILAKLSGFNRMRDAIEHGPPEHTFHGPLLAEAPYPKILVAKAWSTGQDLELVLYDGEGRITTDLQLERLQAGKKYVYNRDSLIADAEGRARMEVTVDGRTVFHLQPVD